MIRADQLTDCRQLRPGLELPWGASDNRPAFIPSSAGASYSVWVTHARDPFEIVESLEDDWDGRGALAPTKGILGTVKRVLDSFAKFVPVLPEVTANLHGTVSIEWEHDSDYASLEVGPVPWLLSCRLMMGDPVSLGLLRASTRQLLSKSRVRLFEADNPRTNGRDIREPMSDAEPKVVSDELERVVSDVQADEFLERFVSANWVDRRGNLKWQALQIHPKDEGALSVARLNDDADQCRNVALGKMNSFVGFAETVAGQITGLGHTVKAEPEVDFSNHAVVNFDGLDPGWPVPHEAGEPGSAKIAETNYYVAILPSFTFFAVPDPDAAEWGADRLGQVA